MSLPKYRILLLAGTIGLTAAGIAGSAAAAAPGAAPAAPQVERVCTGPNQISSDADGKQMRVEVTLCASTDGRTV
ncbi:hypothetical protein [Streptacidiphilus sp. EB103A]|uniref:hypothetical protein n=1 Tax=Streptacidiphilus sp. EB103A TaxID=3156275 RepID=UPI00351491BF